jgi:hypothetical protein
MKKMFTQLSILLGLSATIGMAQAQIPSWVWGRTATNTPTGNNFNNEKVNGVATDAAGNVYVTGEFSKQFNAPTDLDFGGTPATTITADENGNTDVFVAKYNAAGVVQWVKSYGGTYADAGMDIAVDAAGNVVTTGTYMAGTTISATFGTNTYFGTSDMPSIHFYVMKLNPSTGAITWIQKSNSISTCCQMVSSIGTDAANNVYIAGTMYSSTVSFGATSVTQAGGGTSFFYIKFNSSGAPQQGRTSSAGTLGDTRMAVDASGNVYLTGQMLDFSVTISGQPPFTMVGNSNASNFYVLKYSTNGVFQWWSNFGGPGYGSYATGTAICANGNGKVMVAAKYYNVNDGTPGFEQAIEVGGTVYEGSGLSDVILLTLTSAGALDQVSEIKGGDDEVVTDISFNPTTNDFYAVGNFKSSVLNYGVGNALELYNIGSEDIFVINYTESLGDGWALNNTSTNAAQSIASNATSVYVGGAFSAGTVAFGDDVLTNTGFTPSTSDLFVAKVGVCDLSGVDITYTGNLIFCSGNSVTLTASTAASYLWSDGITTTQTLEATEAGDYTVSVIDLGGCEHTSQPITIDLYEVPEVQITADLNLEFCELSAPGTVTTTVPFESYVWYVDAEPAGTGSTEPLDGSATYLVQVIDQYGCSYTSEPATYTMLPDPTISPIAGAYLVTPGQQATYGATATNGTISWEIVGGTILTDPTLSFIEVQWGPEGTGEVTAFSSNTACFVEATFDVEISPVTSINDAPALSFGIYPNPANDYITISSSEQLVGVVILDSYGRMVREFNIITSASQIRLDGLASGVYSVRANFVNGSVVKALLIN